MAAPNANKTFWGFVWYVIHNPYKSVEAMGKQDFINMAEMYAAENEDAITDYQAAGSGAGLKSASKVAFEANSGVFTDVEWPGGTAATGMVTAGMDSVSIQSANYPEKHKGA
jgi:hypothetical protein